MGRKAGALAAGGTGILVSCPRTLPQAPLGPFEDWLTAWALTTCGDSEGVPRGLPAWVGRGQGSERLDGPSTMVTASWRPRAEGGGPAGAGPLWARGGREAQARPRWWEAGGRCCHCSGGGRPVGGGREARARLSAPVTLQVVQPDLEEAGGLQGAGEGAHLGGDCCEDAGKCSPRPGPGQTASQSAHPPAPARAWPSCSPLRLWP